jgi:hypothetical protein
MDIIEYNGRIKYYKCLRYDPKQKEIYEDKYEYINAISLTLGELEDLRKQKAGSQLVWMGLIWG